MHPRTLQGPGSDRQTDNRHTSGPIMDGKIHYKADGFYLLFPVEKASAGHPHTLHGLGADIWIDGR